MLDLTARYAKLVRDEIGAGRVLRHYRTPGLLNGDLWLLWSGNMASSRPGSDEPEIAGRVRERSLPYWGDPVQRTSALDRAQDVQIRHMDQTSVCCIIAVIYFGK